MAAATKTAAKLNGARRVETDIERQARQTQVMRDRVRESAEQNERLAEISNELAKALERGEIDKVGILTANFDTANANSDMTRKNVNRVAAELAASYEGVGVQIKSAKNLSTEEQALIDDATARAEAAKERLDGAEKMLAAAYQKTTFFGIQARAVKNATAVRDAAKAEHDTLVAAIETAKQLAEQQKDIRLQGMGLEVTLDGLQVTTTEIVNLSKDDIGNIEDNLQAVQNSLADVSEQLTSLSQRMEKTRTDRDELNAQIENLTHARDEIADKNSPHWVELDNQKRAAESQRDTVEADHNRALKLYQDAQGFVKKLGLQEQAQRAALQFNQTLIEALQAASVVRDTMYRSHLGALKSGANFQALDSMERAGSVVDEDLALDIARQTAAMRNTIVKTYERAPEDIARLREVENAELQSQAVLDAKMKALYEALRKDYGAEPGYDTRGEAAAGAA